MNWKDRASPSHPRGSCRDKNPARAVRWLPTKHLGRPFSSAGVSHRPEARPLLWRLARDSEMSRGQLSPLRENERLGQIWEAADDSEWALVPTQCCLLQIGRKSRL